MHYAIGDIHNESGKLKQVLEQIEFNEEDHSIWVNDKENVILMDCGAGFKNGKLACMCLETGERFYSS